MFSLPLVARSGSMMMLAVVIAESVALMVPIFLTEKALKEKFGDPPKKK
ncbi:MAG: hypothetical protein VZQ28_04175 [Methanomethylophilus sp.]|nr:hypothetical protein [Methanomethylophilus sp.]